MLLFIIGYVKIGAKACSNLMAAGCSTNALETTAKFAAKITNLILGAIILKTVLSVIALHPGVFLLNCINRLQSKTENWPLASMVTDLVLRLRSI